MDDDGSAGDGGSMSVGGSASDFGTAHDLGKTMFSTRGMTALFSGRSLVERLLIFEAALARAEARAGLIPIAAVDAIAACCRVELLDLPALFRETAASATPAVPLVRMLTALVEGEAQRVVHWGATSQDAMDTAVMLQVRDASDLLVHDLLQAGDACAGLAETHRRTVMPGRTLLQQAVPITFGLKAARWLGLITRGIARLRALRDRGVIAVQLGGAAGTLASLGPHGPDVAAYLAEDLGLARPDLPWHAERDRIGEIAAAVGIVAGAVGKIAFDLILLSQTEVGEISPSSGGRSSAMPHKRNPVEATEALAASRLAIGASSTLLGSMIQEHERSAGALQAEWQALPDLFRFGAGAVEKVGQALQHMDVQADRMLANLDLTGGLSLAEALTMALAEMVGRPEAYRIVEEVSERAAREKIGLRDAAAADGRIHEAITEERLERALDPSAYLGSTDVFIDRALEAYRRMRTWTGAQG